MHSFLALHAAQDTSSCFFPYSSVRVEILKEQLHEPGQLATATYRHRQACKRSLYDNVVCCNLAFEANRYRIRAALLTMIVMSTGIRG